MSDRDPQFFLEDILESCEKIHRYIQSFDNTETLVADEKTFDAVIRNLEVLMFTHIFTCT